MTASPADTSADDAWLATLTVLYVEDEADTRALLARYLRRRVGRLVEAVDGQHGLEQYEATNPALVITDVEMPRLDGLTLADQLHQRAPALPIVVTTAFEQVGYLHRAIAAGVAAYVTKPIDVDRLADVLRGCARRLRGEAALADARQRELEQIRAHQREAIGLLAGGMAHDFNNLLQVVVANLELAAPLIPADTEAAELVDEARRATAQACALGHQLVTLSAGWRPELEAAPLGPTLARAIADAEVVVQLAQAAEPSPVAHDGLLLSRALRHLIDNAREATGGRGEIEVAVDRRTIADGELPPLAAGPYVRLQIRDHGPGIAADVLPRIFDPYFTTKQRGATRGTGLGLAIALAIVRKHGGTLLAASPPDGGAELTMLLPITTTAS